MKLGDCIDIAINMYGCYALLTAIRVEGRNIKVSIAIPLSVLLSLACSSAMARLTLLSLWAIKLDD
jgi:hypothetical protein